MDPLKLPTWVVHPPPGQHLATLEGVLVDEWQAKPDITPDELLRRLTVVARGTCQACGYRSLTEAHEQASRESLEQELMIKRFSTNRPL